MFDWRASSAQLRLVLHLELQFCVTRSCDNPDAVTLLKEVGLRTAKELSSDCASLNAKSDATISLKLAIFKDHEVAEPVTTDYVITRI